MPGGSLNQKKPEIADLSKYVYINFCCHEALIIVHEIRATLIGIKLGTKIYQKIANFI